MSDQPNIVDAVLAEAQDRRANTTTRVQAEHKAILDAFAAADKHMVRIQVFDCDDSTTLDPA
jgi:hypothetical protein